MLAHFTGNKVGARSVKMLLVQAGIVAVLGLLLIAALGISSGQAAPTTSVSIIVDADVTGAGEDEVREADSDERDDRPGVVRRESIVPGVNDMLDAELGLWWQEYDADGVADERPAIVQQPGVVPGLTDVLHAELGPWWTVDRSNNPHPENPDPPRPYA